MTIQKRTNYPDVFSMLKNFEVLQSGPASSSLIHQGVKENTYFLVENHENIEKRRQGKKSNFEDDCGAWSSKLLSMKKTLFHYAGGGGGGNIKMVQLKKRTVLYKTTC